MAQSEKIDVTSGAELDLRSNGRLFHDADLADMKSLNDALSALRAAGATIDDFNDYGTGFSVAEKDTLVGKPLLLIEWRFNENGTYGEFVSILAMTESGEKVVINDGGVGILAQLRLVTAQREQHGLANTQSGMLVRKGLKPSQYTYIDEKGKEIPATTWYLQA